MTIRSKIAAAALGLVLATGAASAQPNTTTKTAPVAAQSQTSATVPVKTTTIVHKTHRIRVSHRKIKHLKMAHRPLRLKLAHTLGLKHLAKVSVAKKHVARGRLVGMQKHAGTTKTTIVR